VRPRRVAEAVEDTASGRAGEPAGAAAQAKHAAVDAELRRGERAEAVLLAAHAATVAERRRANAAEAALRGGCAAADREQRNAKEAIDRVLAAVVKLQSCWSGETCRRCLSADAFAQDMVCGVYAACVSGILRARLQACVTSKDACTIRQE